MIEVELDELVAHLEKHLAEAGADPLASGVVAQAGRLVVLLAAVPKTDPRQLPLVFYQWQRFWALPVGGGKEVLHDALDRAIPFAQHEALPPGLSVLLDVDADWEADPVRWSHAYAAEPNRAIAILEVSAHLSPPDSRQRVVCLYELAVLRFNRYLETENPVDGDAVVDELSEALSIVGETDPQWPALNGSLAVALRTRHRLTGAPQDLDGAITAGRQASPEDPLALSGLAIALRWRFELGGGESDLTDAIPLAQQAVRLMGSAHPELHIALINLARLLSHRHKLTGSERDLDEALTVAARATDSVRYEEDGSAYVDALDTYLEVLTRSARIHRGSDELDRAFEVVDRLLHAVGEPSVLRARFLRWRRSLLIFSSEGGQRPELLDAAISFARDLNEHQLVGQLNQADVQTLAQLLLRRAEITCTLADAGSAVALMTSLFKAPSGRAHPLASHVFAAVDELARTGNPAVLFDEALTGGADLVARAPLGTASDLATTCRLGWLLWFRSSLQDDEVAADQDLSRAFKLFHKVNAVAPFVLPGPVSEYLADLESDADAVETLDERSTFAWLYYEDSGSPAWIDEALRTARITVKAAHDTGVDAEVEAAVLNNLGVMIMGVLRGERTEPMVLEAVAALRRSVELSSPGEPYLPGRLSMLCGALVELHKNNHDPVVLDEAISAGRHGVDLTPEGHPSAGIHMSNLATALSPFQPDVDVLAGEGCRSRTGDHRCVGVATR